MGMYANYMYLSDECLVDLMKFTSDEVFEDDKTIYESVKLLKEIFKNKYPKTKLKPMMKNQELQHLEKNPQFQLTYSRRLVDWCDFNNDLVNKFIEYAYFIEKRK